MKENKFSSKYYFIALGLSTYPVTLLFASNFQNTRLIMYFIPLAADYLFATCVYILFYVLRNKYSLKNIHLSVSIVTIVFFVYGIYYDYFIKTFDLKSQSGVHRYLLLITLVFLYGIFFLINKIKEDSNLYKFFLVFLISCNTMPFLMIANKTIYQKKKKIIYEKEIQKNPLKVNVFPNIYYIILDGYSSNKTLKEILKYDNSNFTNQLNNLGFKVQENASSNYSVTLFSLSSTLNLNYIQNINNDFYDSDAVDLLSNNKVSRFLKSFGYTYYIFDSGYGLKSNYNKKEVLIKTSQNNFINKAFTSSDNDILGALIDNSIFRVIKIKVFSNEFYVAKVLNVFNKLPQIAKKTDRKFVFAHIISPHPPFLFDKNGNSTKYDLQGWQPKPYVEQLKFISKKTLVMLRDIIRNDKQDKMIVIQGDHGSRTLPETKILKPSQKWIQEKYRILNAIYISKNDKSKAIIYKNWNRSSVNTFRIIFNEYFKEKLPLLEDKKYYLEFKDPYKVHEIK